MMNYSASSVIIKEVLQVIEKLALMSKSSYIKERELRYVPTTEKKPFIFIE